MRIAIVDDIAEERKLLRKRLENELAYRFVHVDVYEHESGESFLAAAEKEPFTVVFLDIYMDGITGMDAADKLRTFDTECLLIFTTTSTDHALEGFRVRAMHYLVKPYDETEIAALTEELLRRIPVQDKYMEIKVDGSMIRLRFRNIIYAEHSSHMIYIHTANRKTLTTRQAFGEFTAPLKEDKRFFLCSRGVIANMEHAPDFDGSSFIMEDGSSVFVSKDLAKSARQNFMDYLFGRGTTNDECTSPHP